MEPSSTEPRKRRPSGPAVRHRFEVETMIRFGHCDPAGIVFYPRYLELFNAAVEDWVTNGLGISYAGLVGERRVGMGPVGFQIDFDMPSRMGDMVHFGVSVEHLGNASLRLLLGCRCGDEQRVRMTQTIVCTDITTARSQPFPADLRQAIENYIKN
ncbi:MAG: 4-hydroxybenzoyl-CoA thioesterase [Rhizobacter sp.]|jgi:4-hydroxybenzoyl-CoA thioesterase|nr:4-hydroxybenzoyl-CoA thioesterase [Rhizobacter sp.]